ncbi:type I toxin-antitoxin system Ibs family toxin [Avibacterium paragallinarum]|nr:type I toxin-antitoxin system Ibs family toxin [Avibacterium paragallinarum]
MIRNIIILLVLLLISFPAY